MCSLCLEACKLCLFLWNLVTLSRYVSMSSNLLPPPGHGMGCPISMKNWAFYLKILLNDMFKYFFLLVYSVFFSKDTNSVKSSLYVFHAHYVLFSLFMTVHFPFILLYFLKSVPLVVFSSVSFLFWPHPMWRLLLYPLYFSPLGHFFISFCCFMIFFL